MCIECVVLTAARQISDVVDALIKCGRASNAYQYVQLISFVDVIEGYWLGLIEQVFPATVIWDSGYIYRNTIFDRQKYVHIIDHICIFVFINSLNLNTKKCFNHQ